MKILILNWRDVKNPAGGGAEILTHELAKRWVQLGHEVTQISASFKNAKPIEIIDGVRFIRKGSWWNVHIFACYYYLRHLRKTTDVIIDEVHWFPFFSALYAPKKTIAFVCEVANKLLYTLFPSPIAFGWRLIEKCYLAWYKNVPTIAISKSTYNDLLSEGHVVSNITVIPMGLTAPKKIKHFTKEKHPTLIYVARLNRQKGIYTTIEAFAQVKKKLPDVILWVVGSGNQETTSEVKKYIDSYKISSSVKLFGFVSEEKKFELLSRAQLLVSASVQEGWGLTVPEAGLAKTPAVVYNIQGFRDIIESGKDGVLVEKNPEALAQGILTLLKNTKRYQKLQKAAEEKSKKYSWDQSAKDALQFIQDHTK